MAVTLLGPTKAQNLEETDQGIRDFAAWLAKTTERNEGATDVLNVAPVRVGQSHPSLLYALCTNVKVTRLSQEVQPGVGGELVAGGGVWRIEVTYSTFDSETQNAKSPVYPARPARFNDDGFVEERPTNFDKNGDPIKNSAGDLFNPPFTKPVAIATLTIDVNLRPENVPNKFTYIGKMNSTPYYGAPKHTCWCRAIRRVGPIEERGETYYAVTIVVEYNPDGWKRKGLHVGLRTKSRHEDEPIPIILKTGREATVSYPLDGNGFAILDGDLSKAATFDVDVLHEVSFAGITY